MYSKQFPPLNEQMDIISRGVAEIIPMEELENKLEKSLNKNVPLNIKLGCDPTRPDLHLGHSVVLKKLADFQKLGHTAFLIIGDFTAMIGDPSGRNSTRPPLTFEQSRENAISYFEQASKILDESKTKIVYNSDWLSSMSFEDVIKLTSKYTVARMLERDDFTKRYGSGIPISIHEFLYPLAQAQDSVAIKSDVELGGTDQKFNLLVARDIQREAGIAPQVIITMPLLVGTDGTEKMSKSYDNFIALNDKPFDMYGKTLSIPDELILNYFKLTTNVSNEKLKEIENQLNDPNINPRNIKRELAKIIVSLYYNENEAFLAEQEFDKIFIKKEIPDDIPEYKIINNEIKIIDLIIEVNFASSKSEARRLITQGGVKFNGEEILDPNSSLSISPSDILKVGKRKFVKFIN